jgi:hypothetical protein
MYLVLKHDTRSPVSFFSRDTYKVKNKSNSRTLGSVIAAQSLVLVQPLDGELKFEGHGAHTLSQ